MNNSNPTPKTRGARGRIDLLRALAMAGDDPLRKNALAAVLDFYPKATTAKQTIPSKTNKPESKPIPPKPDLIPQTQPAIRFLPYHLVAVETLANEETWQPVTPELRETQVMSITDITRPWQEGLSQPTMRPIVPWTRLWPKLRRVTARTRLSGLDIAQLTQQLSLGKAIRYLPRKPKLGWPTPLRVVFDFSDRLTPYWNDWHWLRHHLQQRLKKQAHCYRLHGVPQKPLQIFQGNQLSAEFKPWPAMSIGDTLLIVSDLGMIDPAHPQPVSCWQEKLSELARNNIHIIVLSPASQNHLQPRWLNRATLVRLSEDSCLRPVQNRQLAQKTQSAALSPAASQLLTMMSIGTLIEPVLLRALRLGLPERSRDAGLEGEIWCHRELYTATTACAISPWAVQYWREKFNQLPETLQQHTLNCLLHQHAALPQAIHHEEILIWQQAASRTLAAAEQHNADQAREFFNQMADTLLDDETKSGFPRKRLVQMADRHTHWAAELLKQESYIHRLSVAISKIEPERNKDGLPQGIDPAEWLRQSQAIEKQMMQLIHTSHQTFDLTAMDDPVPVGSTRLATLEIDRTTLLYAIEDNCRSSLYRPWPWHSASMDEWPHPQPPQLPVQLKIAAPPDLPTSQPRFILHTGRNQLHFSAFEPPVWASAWGQDRFGLFVDLTIGQTNSVTQRFRWIAPGAFLMGSPETEAERSGNEIQHEVTLTKGFWLADTTVTQALWGTIMPKNPSRFHDNENNPVDTVSRNDAQEFIKRLNDSYPELSVRLPSEAEWEYACRAGTQTPFSFGDNITPEQVNYHDNYPYTGGSKGIYRKKTVPVQSLPPNPWGLYEMHGNVWEWCADWYGEYPKQAAIDPHGPDNGEYRVLRGGSWDFNGWIVRSAQRFRYEPDDRDVIIGFRLAQG